MDISQISKDLEKNLLEVFKNQQPNSLFLPAHYMMEIGGKRLRPSLLILTSCMLGGTVENAMNAAVSMEVFHNFTLIHDDIMDDAPLRRGKETVFKKWDTNTAILSGDVMLIEAYQLLEVYSPEIFAQIIPVFNVMAKTVCIGQQLDMDFQSKSNVLERDYMAMISAKTAALLGCCLQIGAIIVGAVHSTQQTLKQIGLDFGTAFQIQDDWLDCFGDPENIGKRIGGDIVSKKKTLLYIHAMTVCDEKDKTSLESLYHPTSNLASSYLVEKVLDIFIRNKVDLDIFNYFTNLYQEGFSLLQNLQAKDESIKNQILFLLKQISERKG